MFDSCHPKLCRVVSDKNTTRQPDLTALRKRHSCMFMLKDDIYIYSFIQVRLCRPHITHKNNRVLTCTTYIYIHTSLLVEPGRCRHRRTNPTRVRSQLRLVPNLRPNHPLSILPRHCFVSRQQCTRILHP